MDAYKYDIDLKEAIDFDWEIPEENAPCQYTLSELKDRIKQSEESIQKGDYFTVEQLRAKHLKQ